VILSQLLAVLRYEFRMHWRRRPLIVMTFSLIVMNVFMLLLGKDGIDRVLASASASANQLLDLVPLLLNVTYVVILAFFVPLSADAVPIDTQLGTRELLNVLPLKSHTYLFGKFLGMALSLMLAVTIGVAVMAVGAALVFGPYDFGKLVRMLLLALFPLAIFNAGISMLLGATQPSRRRAALIGGAFAIWCFVLFASMLTATIKNEALTVLDFANPVRPPIYRYFFANSAQTVSDGDLALTLLIGGLQLLILGGLTLAWSRYQDVRR
jgi:ABC-type transport system involved in multi-copper enzyme maturation permease subunit